ncbi:hypothetical protein V493_00576 [Pseudogymnoascus sp. VKM F-4281 (FW-2241)]|nr:hypothetical protein V493_00576 [Pseudogymnoascus sp. VKM F-4281 (FW-2241)]
MSTRLSTESGDERCPQKVDAERRGSGSHQNRYSMPSMGHHTSRVPSRPVSNLSAAQLSRKRSNDRKAQRAIRQRTKAHIDQLEQRNRELEDEVSLLKARMAAKNAADNNAGFGMRMDLGQNVGADTANIKWAIDTDNNMTGMVSAFGIEASTGHVYNVSEEGGYEDSAFGHHITQHPCARLNVSSTTVASGNLYTTDLNNSFYGELPIGGQCLKYRRLVPISACVPNFRNESEEERDCAVDGRR